MTRLRPSRIRPAALPFVDALEERVVQSADVVHQLAVHHAPVHAQQTTETIGGRITNDRTGRGVAKVRVELIDGDGVVVKRTMTGDRGRYAFQVSRPGAYVVREITPRGFLQTSPTFLFKAPTGGYGPGFGRSNWNYRTGNDDPTQGPVGPESWGRIAPAGGRPFESPINLSGPTIDLSRFLSVDYEPAVPKAIINNGAQIQTQFNESEADSIQVGGQIFHLLQFHVHDTSENTLDGRVFPMEIHFVNESDSGAESVVAAFIEVGAHNDALDPILNAATANLPNPGTSTTIDTAVDLEKLLPTNTQGYFFQGTLTTPPLSGPINWFVYATPVTMDYAQLMEYEAVANGSGFLPNNRPVQPRDGRALNEFNVDVFVTDTSVTDVNFTIARPIVPASAKTNRKV